MKLLIDDTRDLGTDVIIRTPEAAYITLEKNIPFTHYYFDHDLGFTKPGTNGYDILKWALNHNHINPRAQIQLVTSNPVGRLNMENILKDYGWQKNGNYWKNYWVE